MYIVTLANKIYDNLIYEFSFEDYCEAMDFAKIIIENGYSTEIKKRK